MTIGPPKVANKLFSWALVQQVATCHVHTCVYRRSIYRTFNALAEVYNVKHNDSKPKSLIQTIKTYKTVYDMSLRLGSTKPLT